MQASPGFSEPCVLLADSDIARVNSLRRGMAAGRAHVIEATSAEEALKIVESTCLMKASLDGLIISSELSDTTGHRVVLDFRREFPNASVAIMLDQHTLAAGIRTQTQEIEVMGSRPTPADLERWVTSLHLRVRVLRHRHGY